MGDRNNPSTRCEKRVWSTEKQIAAELFLSPGTVRTYFSELLDKLGAQNRSQAVYLAKEKV
jgi:DNA-binding NarL/FixJ family response regulator